MNIVFAGGMTVSAAILELLCERGATPSHVFGYPDSLKERSNFMPLLSLAKRYGFPLTTTAELNTPDHERIIRESAPDWLVVFGWSELISERILRIPAKGALGLHMSPLPVGRGRAPIPWTLIHDLPKGAVTLFWMTPHADDGDIALQRFFSVSAADDAATLVQRTTELAVAMMRELLPRLSSGDVPRLPQSPAAATSWPKRRPNDGEIQWQAPARHIYNLIRGVTIPFPGAFAFLEGRKIFIWKAGLVEVALTMPWGEILGPFDAHGEEDVGGLAVAAPGGIIICREMQMDGEANVVGRQLSEFARDMRGKRFACQV